MRRMAGLEDGVTDALFRMSRPVTGCHVWCPPMADGDLDLRACRPERRALAQRLRLYLHLIRWDRPAGWLLLLWPTLSALWIAAGGFPRLAPAGWCSRWAPS
jgi:hypothetical protein